MLIMLTYLNGLEWETLITKAPVVWPERVLPLLSTIVPDTCNNTKNNNNNNTILTLITHMWLTLAFQKNFYLHLFLTTFFKETTLKINSNLPHYLIYWHDTHIVSYIFQKITTAIFSCFKRIFWGFITLKKTFWFWINFHYWPNFTHINESLH